MILSCSTCWNSHRHKGGARMLKEIRDLGFANVELGHGIRLSLMEGIQRAYIKGNVRLSSLHNFCPLPVEITHAAPDCYQFSSPDQFERQRAIKQTKQTIDFAQRLGAPLVVLHMGSVKMRSFTDELIEMVKAGDQYSREYVKRKLQAVSIRESKVPGFLKRSLDALKELVPYARERKIKLGVEGRYAFEEIPSEREHLRILEESDPEVVGYWHDFGHIQCKHNLGLLDHEEWLGLVRHRFFGGHLHDTVWPDQDHRAPFTGGINYERLIPILPRETTLVWEMSPRRTAEEIRKSLETWQSRFGGEILPYERIEPKESDPESTDDAEDIE